MRALKLLLLSSLPLASFAQNVGINANGAAPNTSAMLDIDVSAIAGSKRGLLIPRVTTVERNAIPSPATSLLIFNTTAQQFEYFDGTIWRPLLSSANGGWGLTGNAGTNSGSNYVGTSDVIPLSIRTTGVERIFIQSEGSIAFHGSNAPSPVINFGEPRRLLWIPDRGAFRAGEATGSQWDDANVAAGSFATGTNNRASGTNSSAVGQGNDATQANSSAIGLNNQSTAVNSTSIGSTNFIDGTNGTAIGTQNIVNATQGVSIGTQSRTVGTSTIAIGTNTEVNGTNSISVGRDQDLDGSDVIGIGRNISSFGASNSYGFGRNINLINGTNSMLIGFGDPNSAFNALSTIVPGLVGIGNGGNKPTVSITALYGGLTQTGHVGIGTTAPNAKLDVQQDNGAGDDNLINASNDLNETVLRVRADHRVGINEPAPAADLHVRGLFGDPFPLILARSEMFLDPTFVVTSTTAGVGLQTPQAGFHVHHPDGVRITHPSNGSNNGLHLFSSPFSNDAFILNESTSGSLEMRTENGNIRQTTIASGDISLLPAGNVGINTVGPTADLHVAGTMRLEDGTQAAGRVLTSDGLGNATWQAPVAATSAWALTGNTGTNPATNFVGTTDAQALRFRVNNVFAGNIANTATGLVSVGLNAGTVNTALGNTFVGSSAGPVNTTGASNTFLGQGAGAANTTTSNNTYVGTGAGQANTTGAQNVYIGRLAGGNGTTGSDNILIGNGAGIGNTANNNVMIGSFSGNGNSTGGGNTFLGTQSGAATSTGGQNTFIGTGTGITNTIGAQNTLIGNGAALNANNLTNATAIGRGSRVDASDALVLGSVTGINAATTTSRVGIGTTNPLDRLHVVGSIRMVDGNQALGRVLVSDANGTATWVDPLTVAGALTWTLTGNAGTNPATNFLGTTDAQPLRLRVNNVFAGNIANTATGLVSVGLNAGTVNTALGNTFVGSSAGPVNTTGASNTFLGQGAGAANTTTSNNTYVGTGAGQANTTGAQNVYIGRLAGGNGTTGSDNILIGNGAGIGNTANNNVMIGSFSGNGNSTGGGNTFMGTQSGQSTSTGGQNTFIGTGAGSLNTIGTQNTLIGNGAAVGANNLTNATAIGRSSQVDASNALVLGSVNGVNGATATVNVGIGLTTPLTTVDMLGALSIRDDGTVTSVAADNQLVTVGDRGYIRLNSTNNLATARTITLSDGLVRGQLLILQNSLGVNFFEVDDNAATNNTVVPVARVLGVNDTIMLLWNGTDWTELSYSDN